LFTENLTGSFDAARTGAEMTNGSLDTFFPFRIQSTHSHGRQVGVTARVRF
jgi:hypothetical protein